MLSNSQNLNSVTEKILDLYKKEECPLHICVQNGTSYLYHVLNDVNQANRCLNTPLHLAALYQRLDLVLWLLKRGANPQLQNLLRDTPLHIAAAVDKRGFIVQLLLDYQANLQLQNVEGNTPLHIAVSCQNLMAIEHFFNYKNGTEVVLNIINNCGKTPLDLADENKDILNFINKKRKNIARYMVTHQFSLDNYKHFVNNIGIDINNMLLANRQLILTGLINYFNRPGICQPTLNRKLISIKHSIECDARIFQIDGNGKSMMSILVDITDDQRRRSICNTLEKYKDSLCFEKEKSCIEEMPNGSTKEQMHLLLYRWQSGFKLYECIEEVFLSMSALNLVIGERRNTDERQFEEPLTTQSILRGWLQQKNRQHNNTHMDNLNISRPAASRARDAG
ncbi:ankyrin repeat domain-containing protein [Wolbachia endosymbiont of Pentalonia nigronervosa]|uniref:ankyrin repeat domain-containing protein n=1 Tax=Wolbachia endosymbiont of Pentalonia nigronervosa TaxID=1301914 RepID=UPI00165F646C|nr:ankyrin repeat domain-containing protein [Wolbachia endosymbiont of Pentalonia nigronervosa]MBD0391517.1 ankyrin repeat domain-containing protein [Wolbachia endosymbiont of Pentalonia nigronervosa]